MFLSGSFHLNILMLKWFNLSVDMKEISQKVIDILAVLAVKKSQLLFEKLKNIIINLV